ncbi:MAG: hypothetical protein B7Z82_01525 [Halothiobacillus sp. 20-54-6]|nr:MAG: hypothetical protein B7Z82_01525 [Halothiobacillus sp. 20-54-6]
MRTDSLSLGDVFIVLLLGGIAYFWWQQDQLHRRALALAKQACSRVGAQFLDESVGLRRLRLRRVEGGLVLERVFSFEFTPSGAARFAGSVIFVGRRVEAVDLDLSAPLPEG